ncbi:hypothetical protein NGRA_1439 [Nosema granulosis]|uniref:Uncharacterized protein n=1 Tax=Nosema granulosis TaxID=83296 RepID=A0A9P6GYH5_9MICR|nr:hypothetical protein NGRA_1439 [Nosema granulosis]
MLILIYYTQLVFTNLSYNLEIFTGYDENFDCLSLSNNTDNTVSNLYSIVVFDGIKEKMCFLKSYKLKNNNISDKQLDFEEIINVQTNIVCKDKIKRKKDQYFQKMGVLGYPEGEYYELRHYVEFGEQVLFEDNISSVYSDVVSIDSRNLNYLILKRHRDYDFNKKSLDCLTKCNETIRSLFKKLDEEIYEVIHSLEKASLDELFFSKGLRFSYFSDKNEIINILKSILVILEKDENDLQGVLEKLKRETTNKDFDVYRMIVDITNIICSRTLLSSVWELVPSIIKDPKDEIIQIHYSLVIKLEVELKDVEIEFLNSLKEPFDMSINYKIVGKSIIINYEEFKNPNQCYINIKVGKEETGPIEIYPHSFQSLANKRRRLDLLTKG